MKTTHASPPSRCDLCHQPINTVFVDGKTAGGPWGYMCPGCHAKHGVGFGTGQGQKYERTPPSPDFVKVSG